MSKACVYNEETLVKLRKQYHLPEDFPGKLPVTRKTIRACNSHSPCVGRGHDLIFRYSDGSSDTGHDRILCQCKVGNSVFGWSEEKP